MIRSCLTICCISLLRGKSVFGEVSSVKSPLAEMPEPFILSLHQLKIGARLQDFVGERRNAERNSFVMGEMNRRCLNAQRMSAFTPGYLVPMTQTEESWPFNYSRGRNKCL